MRTLRPALLLLLLVLLGLLSGCAGIGSRDAPPSPFERLETSHFRFLIEGGRLDAESRRSLIAEAESSRSKILHWLGAAARPGDFSSPKQRSKRLAKQVPKSSALEKIEVRILSGPGRCQADASGIELRAGHIKRHDLTHELVHYLAGRSWRPINEGLATWLTEKFQGAARGYSVDIRARVYRELSTLRNLDRKRLRGQMSRRDYDVAASFVGFLIERFGKARFLQLYGGVEGNFHGLLGIPETDLFMAWERRVADMSVEDSRAFYRFRAMITTGLQEAGAPNSQLIEEGSIASE